MTAMPLRAAFQSCFQSAARTSHSSASSSRSADATSAKYTSASGSRSQASPSARARVALLAASGLVSRVRRSASNRFNASRGALRARRAKASSNCFASTPAAESASNASIDSRGFSMRSAHFRSGAACARGKPLRDDAREARLAIAEQTPRALGDERVVDAAALTQPLKHRLALRRQLVRREPALGDRRLEPGCLLKRDPRVQLRAGERLARTRGIVVIEQLLPLARGARGSRAMRGAAAPSPARGRARSENPR